MALAALTHAMAYVCPTTLDAVAVAAKCLHFDTRLQQQLLADSLVLA